MAVPKRKTSKSRRDMRRASNIQYIAPNVMECPQCHKPVMAHRACGNCGFYDGKQVIEVAQ